MTFVTEEGHEAVVKRLLMKDGVGLDSKENFGRKLLQKAAENVNEAVVKLLLDRASTLRTRTIGHC